MKNNKILISVVAVSIGMSLNRTIGSYYGEAGRKVLVIIVGSIVLLSILHLIVKKKYLIAINVSSIVIPLIISVVGSYLDNSYLSIGGIALVFIIAPIVIRVTAKFKNQNKL